MGDEKVNTIEGENIPDTKQVEFSQTAVAQAETNETSVINEQEALKFVVENQNKIGQATKEIKDQNDNLFNLDKAKDLINGELEVLKLKAYELANNVKKNMSWSHIGKTVATSSLILFSACSSIKEDVAMAVPQEMTETQEVFTPTPTFEATLSPEEIRENRLNEIAEVVKENDNTFTVEELDAYLQKYGTGWEGGVEAMMEYYKGTLMPFQYYFIKNSYKESGVFLTSRPFINSREMTMSDMNNFPTPKVVSEEMLGRITEAIYIDLFPKNGNGRDMLWEDVPGKYTVIVYLSEEMCEDGVLRDIARLNIGGYFNYDEKGMVKYISPEKAKGYNFSDEELALMKQGYSTFIHIPYEGVIGAGKSENGLPGDCS